MIPKTFFDFEKKYFLSKLKFWLRIRKIFDQKTEKFQKWRKIVQYIDFESKIERILGTLIKLRSNRP